jgi:predicted Zn-dependent protease with MMP-like domain/tetratricopeptide (TPR) repeat protein
MWRGRARREPTVVSEPGLGDGGGGPSLLLRPERAVVGFTGRGRELDLLRAWCGAGEARAVRVVAGAGGVGKTRLALEVAAGWAAPGGRVVQVAAGAEAGVLEQARAVSKGPLLLIADHVETLGGLGALLKGVAADPGPVRVLLVARSLGEWWDRLAGESAPPVAVLLAGHDPVLIDAPVTGAPDADLAAAAVPFFAGRLGVPVPKRVVFGLPGDRVPVLMLHAAALVAVLRSRTSPSGPLRVAVTSGLISELLEHEARYWQRTAAAAGLSGDGRVLNAAVAALVVAGADDEGQTAAAARRVPDLAGLADEELRQWGTWLAGLYPGADGEMGPVQPGLLAEHHAVTELAADPALARAVLSGLEGRQAVRALTVLGRAWELHEEAGPVIGAALRADLAGLAAPAGQVTIATQPRIDTLLAEALDTAPPTAEDLARIAEALPYPSVALAGTHLAVALRIRREQPPGTSREDAARWAQRCGLLLSQAGRLADALPVTQEAVTLYRELADELPDRYRPELAAALSDLGDRFRELGRPADAFPVTEEAVAIRRELGAALPDRYRPGLAASLSNLGVRFAELGRPADALPVTQEAVAIRRELAAALPDRYRSGLALSLSNLAKVLSALGRDDEAAAAATERDSIRSEERPGPRPLIEVEPDRFEDMVATALDGLPEDLGRLMDNVAVTVEHDKGRPGLLGLYQGVPLTKRPTNYGMRLPDKITIYRQAICANCRSEQEVIEKVRRVVIHEVGHHFGIDDDRLRELGW